MTRYRVLILPEALAQLDRLPGHVRGRVRRAIIALRDDPQPHDYDNLDALVEETDADR
jgi:mRNA-degrading endonuclease RelE of RelBE toxin-antitoxin system